MLSVYHASARSKRESPVLNLPPRLVSFAEYSLLSVSNVSFVTVDGSIRRSLINVLNRASSWSGETLRLRTEPLNVVPSFNCRHTTRSVQVGGYGVMSDSRWSQRELGYAESCLGRCAGTDAQAGSSREAQQQVAIADCSEFLRLIRS